MSAGRKGFTLTELVVTLLVVAVGVGLFSSVFINNWSAYEDRIRRANLWSEANQFFEQMSVEGRNARLIDVTVVANAKNAAFTNAADNSVTTFTITDTGILTSTKGAAVKTFSTHAVFANSNFTKNGKDLIVDLQLKESVFSRDIHINASTEILPRN